MDSFIFSKNMLECPIAIKWIISKFRLDELKFSSSSNQYLKSDTWNAFGQESGIQYCLYFYPWIQNAGNGKKESWIFLNVKLGNQKTVECEYKIIIETSNFSSAKKQAYDGSSIVQGIFLCSSEDLLNPGKKFIVDDKLIINVEGILKMEQQYDQQPPRLMEYGCNNNLGDSLWERNDKDFVIKVDGNEINVHKLILSSRSPVFKKMFETNMKESAENQVEIIDFPFKIVEAAIFMCYQKTYSITLTTDDYMLLLQFFDKYMIENLKDNIENFLIDNINESTVCKFVNCSILSNAPKLYQKCGDFLKDAAENNIPVNDLELIDKELAVNLLKNVFCYVSKSF